VKKLNKRDIIKKIVTEPSTQKRMFWAREMKMLNDLMNMFESEDFWQKVSLDKVPSLAVLRSGHGLSMLSKKYKEFNYKIPKKIEIPLGKKTGRDKIISKKPKTIRQFIDEQN
tara:strand:- start:47 stop:385 length:339 start_codon:yes stop_codon:yes gene_type:complete